MYVVPVIKTGRLAALVYFDFYSYYVQNILPWADDDILSHSTFQCTKHIRGSKMIFWNNQNIVLTVDDFHNQYFSRIFYQTKWIHCTNVDGYQLCLLGFSVKIDCKIKVLTKWYAYNRAYYQFVVMVII